MNNQRQDTPIPHPAEDVRPAKVIALAIFLSRILGVVRQAMIAPLLGHGYEADAFNNSYEIPHLLRRVLGEGGISLAVVPLFTEYEAKHGREEAWRFVQVLWNLILVLTAVLSALGVLLAPWIVYVLNPGYHAHPEFQVLATTLTRIMLPFMLLISLTSLCMGIHNVRRSFALPALGPAAANVVLIATCLLAWGKVPGNAARWIAWGVLLTGLARLGMLVPYLWRQGMPFRFIFNPRHPGVHALFKMMLPAVFGMAVAQINILVTGALATLIFEGARTYLANSILIAQLPISLFGVALGTAILPPLSKAAVAGDKEQMRRTFVRAARLVLFFSVPAALGLIVLRQPLIAMICQRENWTAVATRMTAFALLFHALGVVAVAGLRVVTSVFYAQKDMWTPAKTGAAAVVVNIVGALILMNTRLVHGGLALATTLAAAVNLVLLVWILRRRMTRIGGREILVFLFRVGPLWLIMTVVCYLVRFGLDRIDMPEGTVKWAIVVFGTALVGVGVYLLGAVTLKLQELSILGKGGRPHGGSEDQAR